MSNDDVVGSTRSKTIEELTRTDFVKYAGASGDFNPVHHDRGVARAAGHPDVFAQGMLTGGITASALTEWFGVENVKKLRTRFEGRVWPGDRLTVCGEIVDVTEGETGVVGTVRLEVRNQHDEAVVTGDALVSLG